jgi:hypothetical protein
MIFNNTCKECGKKILSQKDLLNVIKTGYCVSCEDYLKSDDSIAHREGITFEIDDDFLQTA